jgi:endonuclease/exonuclease/phosphatase family metal-dependent hydrolase
MSRVKILVAAGIMLPLLASAGETLRVLSANIGNNDLRCAGYNWKLCLKPVEDRVRESVRALAPEVVALQEISTAAQCEKKIERRPRKVCAPPNRTEAEEQTRRILGPDYTIAIAKGRYEAIAVKVSAGTIQGCEPGAICWTEFLPELPQGCDPGFSVSAVDAVLKGKEVRIVNLHPDSIKSRCRALELEQGFALASGPQNLLLGDWNTDPYHRKGEDVQVWKREVQQRRLTVHSGIAEHDPPYFTDLVPWPWPDKTLDHVMSDFARGTCTTLGVAPGTRRLDDHGDLDHRGLLCELTMP